VYDPAVTLNVMFFPVELLVAPFNVTDHVVDKGSPASTKLTGTVPAVGVKSAVTEVTPVTVAVTGFADVEEHAAAGEQFHPENTYPALATALTVTPAPES
jgi:hypothetical protein